MTYNEIRDRLVRTIQSTFELPDNYKIDFSDNILNTGINSITFIKFVVAIENEFEFEFEDEKLNYNNFYSLDLLCEYIKQNVDNQ